MKMPHYITKNLPEQNRWVTRKSEVEFPQVGADTRQERKVAKSMSLSSGNSLQRFNELIHTAILSDLAEQLEFKYWPVLGLKLEKMSGVVSRNLISRIA